MAHRDWNARYQSGDLPWDSGVPEARLVEFVEALPGRGRALDIGCGTGTNAIWLARNGFDTVGVDLSPLAIEKAREKLGELPLACRFEALDLLAEPLPEGPYDLVFDRGCLHVFDEAAERAHFAAAVAQVLRPGGLWLSLAGSTEGPPRDSGPPRRSLRELADAIEPELEIVSVRAIDFLPDRPLPAAGWICVSRRRSIPAQPPSGR